MGQSISIHREREAFSHRESRRSSQLIQARDLSSATEGRRLRPRDTGSTHNLQRSASTASVAAQSRESRPTQPYATFRRQVSALSTTATDSSIGAGTASSTRDEVLYEQEERPLVNMEDLHMRDAPITHITASPMPRRLSVLSRLGSRLLPRYAPVSSAGADDDGNEPRRTLRRRLSDIAPPQPSVPSESEGSEDYRRFSVFSSLSPRLSAPARSIPRRHHAPISRPIPLMADGSVPPSGFTMSPLHPSIPETSLTPFHPSNFPSTFGTSASRNTRMSRVRRSISSLENLFSGNSSQSLNDRQTHIPPRRPSRTAIADETDYLLPPLNVTNTSLDLDEMALTTFEGTGTRLLESSPTAPDSGGRSPSWAQRWADRAPTVRRETRRMPNLLRGRSSRIIRRDDEAPLSRILQLAAAAIAAQLSGVPDGITDLEPMSDDTLDGSLNAFMESMNSAAGNAAALNDTTNALATLPPLNFLRVFRFVNSHAENRQDGGRISRQSSARDSVPTTAHEADEASDGRTVTLVVVGVRSVPSSSISREETDDNIDQLMNIPLVPQASLRNGAIGGGLLRHASGRSRFQSRRRASMGGLNPFPANYDSQRHHRMQGTSRSTSGDTTPVTAATIPVVVSESPAGPHPPPSTPADPGLSAHPSGTSTPSRRPSSASATHSPHEFYRDNALARLSESHDLQIPTNDPYHAVRQRRRSDSEFARHRDLGAGAARRNGVVEPDDAAPQGRSWLIYVVGTNLSEDHPAFATPSLFTDVSGHTCSLCVGQQSDTNLI